MITENSDILLPGSCLLLSTLYYCQTVTNKIEHFSKGHIYHSFYFLIWFSVLGSCYLFYFICSLKYTIPSLDRNQMLFRELSDCFTANSLSSQFRFSFWSLFVYDQLAICYLKLEAVLQPRSMEDLDCQAWDHCTSTSYGKWNYCQLNLEYILLHISRKASKQDIAAILGLKSAFHFDYDYHCSQGHAIKGNRQICSTKYRFRQNLFPTVISINLIAIPLHAGMNFQLRARAVFTVTPFMYPFWAPLQIFHLEPGCYFFSV